MGTCLDYCHSRGWQCDASLRPETGDVRRWEAREELQTGTRNDTRFEHRFSGVPTVIVVNNEVIVNVPENIHDDRVRRVASHVPVDLREIQFTQT